MKASEQILTTQRRNLQKSSSVSRQLKHKSKSKASKSGPPKAPTLAPPANVVTVVDEADGSLTSTCEDAVPVNVSSVAKVKEMELDYYLYLPGAAAADAKAAELEEILHNGIAEQALWCDFTGDFVVTELSSLPLDSVIGICQDVTPQAGQTCWQVRAKMTFTLATQLSESQIMELIAGYAQSTLSSTVNGATILDAQVQGFANVDLTGSTNTLAGVTGTPDVAQINRSSFAIQDQPRPMGPLVLAAAGLLFLVFAALFLSRRRKRQAAFLAYLEKLEDLEEADPPMESPHNQVIILGESEDEENTLDLDVLPSDLLPPPPPQEPGPTFLSIRK